MSVITNGNMFPLACEHQVKSIYLPIKKSWILLSLHISMLTNDTFVMLFSHTLIFPETGEYGKSYGKYL